VITTRSMAFNVRISAAMVALSMAAIVFATGPSHANPTFARMTGHTCAVCHVPAQEPLLNPTGQEFKGCGFSFCKGPPSADVRPAPQPIPRPVPQPTVAGPSFACSGRLSQVEAAICSDRDLAALDVRMDAVYQRALANAGAGEAEGLRIDQRAFLAERNTCDTDHECIRQSYIARITAMQRR
jgi:Lysozyme inhibitor LprI